VSSKIATFTAAQFVATNFESAAEKASFANNLMRFLESDCPRSQFTQKLYDHLSDCFQHIAECDKDGFYSVWFATAVEKLDFLKNLLQSPCYGDPQWTFSDVECALQTAISDTTLLAQYQLRANAFVNCQELALLATLQARHPEASTYRAEPEQLFPLEVEAPVMQANLFA
jgi:hypothetical protein